MPKDAKGIRLLTLKDLAFFKDEEEKKKCEGKYIATESFKNKEVLRDDRGEPIANVNPMDTLKKARRMGYEEPVIFYYLDFSRKYIFSASVR